MEDGRLMRYFNETKAFAFLLDSSGKCVPLHSLQSVTDPSNVKVWEIPLSRRNGSMLVFIGCFR